MSDKPKESPEVHRVAKPGGRRAFLQSLSKGAAVGATAAIGDSCNKKNPGTPTGATPTTTVASTTIATTSTLTTTSVATTVAPTYTLAGVVTDRSGRPVVGCRVFVVDGPNANKSSNCDGNGYYSIPGLIGGAFTLRTTMNGVFLYDQPVLVNRDTRLDFSVTTTSTTTSSTSSVATSAPSTSSTTPGGTIHYWYPN